MSQMIPIVIGISGTSCGGKTLLCERIAEKYSSVVISMDDYYKWPDTDLRLEEYNFNYANFEVAEAVDFERLLLDLEKKLNSISKSQANNGYPIVLVEGILIYDFRLLQKYFKKRYFLTLTKEIAEKRRSQRTYEPPDPLGYFEKYVWPYYERHRASLSDQTDIIYLDGSSDFNVNLEKVCQDLDDLLISSE